MSRWRVTKLVKLKSGVIEQTSSSFPSPGKMHQQGRNWIIDYLEQPELPYKISYYDKRLKKSHGQLWGNGWYRYRIELIRSVGFRDCASRKETDTLDEALEAFNEMMSDSKKIPNAYKLAIIDIHENNEVIRQESGNGWAEE